MVAANICWIVDLDEAYEKLDSMPVNQASEVLEISVQTYADMTTPERHDYAYDSWHYHRTLLDEFMGLPNEVEIPEVLEADEDISDWLSNEYGFCHEGFDIVTE